MKNTLILTAFTILFLISCSYRGDKSKLLNTDTVIPGIRHTKEFKDIDTTISLTLYDLSPHEKKASLNQKKKIISAAITSTMQNDDFRYLELPCWKFDTIGKEPYKDTTLKAPDCRINDFFLIDIDSDGDVDILYSSLVDQYMQWDSNSLLILQNNNGVYRRFDIVGYLYDIDYVQQSKGKIILKTVSRPCCDYSNFNFNSTTFDTQTWTFDTKHILEIHESKVIEKY